MDQRYIIQILNFNDESKTLVVDINENGLTVLTRDLRSSNLLDYWILLLIPLNNRLTFVQMFR